MKIHFEKNVSSVSILCECGEVFRRYDEDKTTTDLSKISCDECKKIMADKSIGLNI
jgi:hypothetical protein